MNGLKELLKNLDKIEKDLDRQCMQALKNEAKRIMTDSNEHYAPRDKGNLIEESQVLEPVKIGDTFAIEMGYGFGESRDYALPLHEHPSASSPPTWNGVALTFTKPGTGEKYLERPLFKAIDGMVNRLAADIKIE
jgi:hypothetical protein